MDKIISLLVENPGREFHIREIAKIVKASPTTVSKIVKQLKYKGIVSTVMVSNHLMVKAKSESPMVKSLKKERNLRKLHDSGLIPCLEHNLNSPEAVILFGSYAKGEDIPSSDIDIFVVTPARKELDLKAYEKKLKHPIQLFIHSRAEIERMKSKNKGLLNNLINGIVVSGYWEVFR